MAHRLTSLLRTFGAGAILTALACTPLPARAQIVKTPGDACTTADAAFWEQSSICNLASGQWQRPAFQFGSAILGCTATTAGMVQWTGAALQLCDGSSWSDFSFAGSVLLGTATNATSPQKSGDATTGFFSDTATSVSVAITGTEYLRLTSSSLNITGDIKIGSIANAYYLGGNKILFQPASDTTSLAIGANALAAQTITNIYNTAVGYGALQSSTATAGGSTALGYLALNKNTTGASNTAIGYKALYENTTASYSTAIGNEALASNKTGTYNVAVGNEALKSNVSGGTNTAFGASAITALTSGGNNTAVGAYAMSAMISGSGNLALGYNAMQYTSSGANYNVAVGHAALGANTSGDYNVAIGPDVGTTTLQTGSYNILIGTSSAVDTPTSSTSNWLNIGNAIYGDMAAGKIGIATASPQATLDVNGYMRMAANASQPVACGASNLGSVAVTSSYMLCSCATAGASQAWVKTTDGVTACAW